MPTRERLFRAYDLSLAAAALAVLLAIFAFNLSCAPTYYLRADVIAIAIVISGIVITLLWAGTRETEGSRVASVAGSAALLTVLTYTLPLATPLALPGAVRVPKSHSATVVAALLAILAVLLARGLPAAGQFLMTGAQFLCP